MRPARTKHWLAAVMLMTAVQVIQAQNGRIPSSAAPPPLVPGVINAPENDESPDELDDLDALLKLSDDDVSQLSQVQVTQPSVAPSLDAVVSTVERKDSTVGRTPAAVYVITRDMIRRSGARHLPEALRMAPGVQVAQIDANKWAVSIRGFNSRFANKLLVQIDGRSVYNPLFGGVFWDAQSVLLEDVERIEVVRGPGGTVWGANAVNGVINVVTRTAKDTHGTFVEGGGGNLERSYAGFRQGGSISENADLRISGQWDERSDFESATQHDSWRRARVGARLDWSANSSDSFTLQGDYYEGSAGTLSAFAAPAPALVELNAYRENTQGGNVLFRWNRQLTEDSDWQLQTYYEHTDRMFEGAGSGYTRDTWDVDFQHRFPLAENHELIWGAHYRATRDNLQPQPFFLTADPQRRSFDTISTFVQDTVTLSPDYLALTLGTKLSYNDFTGGEVQPSARLLWTPSKRLSGWLAASRAVRTATRLTQDGRVVLPPTSGIYRLIEGNPDIESEDVFSLEAGIRQQPSSDFSWDLAVFWNRYEDLVGLGSLTGIVSGPEGFLASIPFTNSGSAQTYGVELASLFHLTETWSLRTNYTFLKVNLDGSILGGSGDAPSHQVYLQSSHQLSSQVDLDLTWRWVDQLPSQQVAAYSALDLRLGFRPNDVAEFYIMGTNLLDAEHPEFGNDPFAGTQATQVPRGVFAGVMLRY